MRARNAADRGTLREPYTQMVSVAQNGLTSREEKLDEWTVHTTPGTFGSLSEDSSASL